MRAKLTLSGREKSLKNDEWREKERERERREQKERVLSYSRIAEKFRAEGDLARNYPQTIVKLSLLLTLFSVRTVYDVPKILRKFAPLRLRIFAQRHFHFNSSVCRSTALLLQEAAVLYSALPRR